MAEWSDQVRQLVEENVGGRVSDSVFDAFNMAVEQATDDDQQAAIVQALASDADAVDALGRYLTELSENPSAFPELENLGDPPPIPTDLPPDQTIGVILHEGGLALGGPDVCWLPFTPGRLSVPTPFPQVDADSVMEKVAGKGQELKDPSSEDGSRQRADEAIIDPVVGDDTGGFAGTPSSLLTEGPEEGREEATLDGDEWRPDDIVEGGPVTEIPLDVAATQAGPEGLGEPLPGEEVAEAIARLGTDPLGFEMPGSGDIESSIDELRASESWAEATGQDPESLKAAASSGLGADPRIAADTGATDTQSDSDTKGSDSDTKDSDTKDSDTKGSDTEDSDSGSGTVVVTTEGTDSEGTDSGGSTVETTVVTDPATGVTSVSQDWQSADGSSGTYAAIVGPDGNILEEEGTAAPDPRTTTPDPEGGGGDPNLGPKPDLMDDPLWIGNVAMGETHDPNQPLGAGSLMQPGPGETTGVPGGDESGGEQEDSSTTTTHPSSGERDVEAVEGLPKEIQEGVDPYAYWPDEDSGSEIPEIPEGEPPADNTLIDPPEVLGGDGDPGGDSTMLDDGLDE